MSLDYVNFCLNLEEKYLNNRFFIELYFLKYFKKMALVETNSNNFNSIICSVYQKRPNFKNKILKILYSYNKSKISFYTESIDLKAINNCLNEFYYPLLENDTDLHFLIEKEKIKDLIEKASLLSEVYYNKIVTLQSIAFVVKFLLNK